MAYIIFVNPAILRAAGMPPEGTVVATCLVAGIMTIAMGLATDYPFAIAPGMGVNAAIAYNVVVGMKQPWPVAMGMIILEGAAAVALVLARLRETIMNAIPLALKHAIAVGIGLFIAIIGLFEGGMIAHRPATVIGLGDLGSRPAMVTLLGLSATFAFLTLKIRGAILLGIFSPALAGIGLGVVPLPERFFSVPTDFSTIFAADIRGALNLSLLPMIFALFMTDFFDTMGTVIGISQETGFLDEKGRLPRLSRVLLVDSLGAVTGGFLGASSATTYIESAAGISEGARRGGASLITGLLFFASLFFTPLVALIAGGYQISGEVVRHPVTAPALIAVGFLILPLITRINWERYDESIPAFLIILLIPMTYSISHGIGAGVITYVLLKALAGRAREIHPILGVVAGFFLLMFLME